MSVSPWLKTLKSLDELSVNDWSNVKRRGFADVQISRALNCTEDEVRAERLAAGVKPSMKRVDTCAAEFEAGAYTVELNLSHFRQ